jgi:hypothetical protein
MFTANRTTCSELHTSIAYSNTFVTVRQYLLSKCTLANGRLCVNKNASELCRISHMIVYCFSDNESESLEYDC